MQPLQRASSRMARGAVDELLEVIPEVMYFLRTTLGENRPVNLTVAQARALAITRRRPNGSLSDVAQLLGVSLPAASRIVTGLVTRKYIRRQACPRDRRNVRLMLTPDGERQLDAAIKVGRESLARRLSGLSVDEQKTLRVAGAILRRVFAHDATKI